MALNTSKDLLVTYSPKKKAKQYTSRNNLAAYGFMTPWLLGMLLLTLGSIAFSLYLAFTSYDLLSAPKWVGLANFKTLFTQDSFFTAALKATFLYVVISVPLRLAFSLLIAMLLNRNIRGISVYRALYYLPSLVGNSVGVSIGWKEMFGNDGSINAMLAHLGINGPPWLADPHYAMLVIVLLSVWQFGSEMVIFLAGLKQIPDVYYEAASIDGASKIRQFFHVTLPMLTPIIFFNLVMGTISAFMVFTQVFIITNGGPLNSTLMYVLYLYNEAFTYFHMGYAAALAIILLLIIGLCSGFLFLTSKYWVHYGD